MEEEKKVKTAKAEDKKEPAKKAPAKKAEPAEAKKPSAAALKAALAQMEEKETGKKKNTVLWRVLAFVMWALAIVAMYLPQLGDLELPFGAMRMLVLKNYTPMIIDIVVAVALCIGAALLWKKANHIHPIKSHNKVAQFIWNQLGLIMAFLIFFVIGLVLILKNDKLDAKTKKIAIAALAAITLGHPGVQHRHPGSRRLLLDHLRQEVSPLRRLPGPDQHLRGKPAPHLPAGSLGEQPGRAVQLLRQAGHCQRAGRHQRRHPRQSVTTPYERSCPRAAPFFILRYTVRGVRLI